MRFVVEYLDGHFVKYPKVDYVIMRSGMIELYRDNADIPRGTQMPMLAINLGLVAHYWLKGDSTMFDTKTEEYLHENHGNLQEFMRLINADSITVGAAFVHCLSEPDRYRATKAGKGKELSRETEFDSPAILEFIAWLDTDREKYPEDHPVWSMR